METSKVDDDDDGEADDIKQALYVGTKTHWL